MGNTCFTHPPLTWNVITNCPGDGPVQPDPGRRSHRDQEAYKQKGSQPGLPTLLFTKFQDSVSNYQMIRLITFLEKQGQTTFRLRVIQPQCVGDGRALEVTLSNPLILMMGKLGPRKRRYLPKVTELLATKPSCLIVTLAQLTCDPCCEPGLHRAHWQI